MLRSTADLRTNMLLADICICHCILHVYIYVYVYVYVYIYVRVYADVYAYVHVYDVYVYNFYSLCLCL